MHCYLTIDLEDYKHATMRDMKISPIADPDQTARGVRNILSILSDSPGKKTATFFTTGQVAREQPELISELSHAGHEIGCHTNEHDYVWDMSREEFNNDLEKAIESIQNCSGKKVLGFRAPNFSIDKNCSWFYEVLAEQGFAYDSSIVKENDSEGAGEYETLNHLKSEFYEFPLVSFPFFNLVNIKIIGGTYFRLLPASVIIGLMNKVLKNGFVPIIYLHPHDLDDAFTPIRFHEMANLSLKSKIKWRLHQFLWSAGTQSASQKLKAILKKFPNKGPMLESLPVST